MTEHGRWAGGPGPRWATVTPKALVIAFAAIFLSPTTAASEESDARTLAAHVLSLRSAAVSGEAAALSVLADVPGAASAEAPELLWPPFFGNAMVKLGRLHSARPVALYYNPLLDVALITLWEKTENGYRVGSARVFPGERPTVPADEIPLRPAWMSSGEGPLSALPDLAAARLATFGRDHPVQATGDAVEDVGFAGAAADFRAALPRLAWNVLQRARWAAAGSWLGPVLTRVERALQSDDAAAVQAMAPDTDDATAAALAKLPAGFARGLALDMTVQGSGGERLLIGSRREDGDIYVFALCRLDGDVCVLRRLMLISLSG